MSALMACDQCGGTAHPDHAAQHWLQLIWATGVNHDPVANFFGGGPRIQHTSREFCSASCLGLFATMSASCERTT